MKTRFFLPLTVALVLISFGTVALADDIKSVSVILDP